MKRLAIAIVVLTGLALLAGRGSASPAGHWVATDIDHAAQLAFPNYTRRYLLGMTPGGRVMWTAEKAGGGPSVLEVFQWQNGQVSDLGTLPEHGGRSDWNSGGAIAGTVGDPPYCPHVVLTPAPCTPGPKHAYLWQPGKATPLGTLGGKSAGAWAVNDRGQVVGWSETARGVQHAFLWQNGKMTDISPRGDVYGIGTAINDRGQVIVDAVSKKTGGYYLWQAGKLTKIDLTGNAWTLNDLGEVIGEWLKRPWTHAHVFLWRDGETIDLGPSDHALDSLIDDRGDVVISRVVGATARAVLWRSGRFTDLGDLGGGWASPAAVNDRGQIVGTSTLPGSKEQDYHAAAFVWQDGKMTRLPDSPDLFGATMAIDASGTHIVLGWPYLSCTLKSCAGQIVLWTYVP